LAENVGPHVVVRRLGQNAAPASDVVDVGSEVHVLSLIGVLILVLVGFFEEPVHFGGGKLEHLARDLNPFLLWDSLVL